MKRYEEYKDSGVEWIGEVPKHWEVIKTSLLYPNIGSGTTPSTSRKDYYTEEGYFWLQTGDLNDGIITNTSKKISKIAVQECNIKFYSAGSIVIAMYGATIGKIGLLKIKTATNQACCVLPQSNNMNESFSFYIYQIAKSQMLLEAVGGGQPNISQNIISRLKVPVPPLPEQLAIASYLDKRCGEIDKAIDCQRQRIALLEELRQSIITHAVTRGLDPKMPLKDSGVEWIGMVPEHWKMHRFKDFLAFKNLVSTDENKIGLENIESKTGKFIETNTEFNGNGMAFDKGDIVYGKLRPYLQKVWVATFKGNAVGDFYVFKPKTNCHNQYAFYVMLSNGFTLICNGATLGAKMPRVSSDFIRGLYYFLPPLPEQRAIASYLDKRCKKIENTIANQQKQISLLQELKQSIITEAVTGKVKVYEP